MRASAGKATEVLRLLGNPDRLLLLCQLTQEELCVSEMEERLQIRQPTLSQQLGVLRRENLVATRREGKNIYYRITDARVLEILQTLYRLYCDQE
ncbi:ArsR/SmtB family transcription factor [Marinobacter sp.]|uniref:ArsR/SmtB family transcription factor n=1 Tax=Marinobacter sp. TaxID=50741 RepID=UPI0038506B00